MREWLKNLRQERGMTQQQVAKKMGLSTSYYSFIETGFRQKKMDIVVIAKLAEVFDISIQEIADLETAYKAGIDSP